MSIPVVHEKGQGDRLHFSILDPTGNITALVEDPVELSKQPLVAAEIMRRYPEVEQVGYLTYRKEGESRVQMRMAGGEFCGNASMSAAALYQMRCGNRDLALTDSPVCLTLKVSGAAQPVRVQLDQIGNDAFRCSIDMPPAISIEEKRFEYKKLCGVLPLVRMEGIIHLIIEQDSPFYALIHDRQSAQEAVRSWCSQLGADGLGLMFLGGSPVRSDRSQNSGSSLERKDHKGSEKVAESDLTPLVYIPGSDTVFWENSCASGTSAAGMYIADRSEVPVAMSFREPGGRLEVESHSAAGITRLYGKVRLIDHCTISLQGKKS